MASEAKILKAVRLELGDLVEPFRDSFRGDGEQTNWDLSARNIIEDSVVAVSMDTSVTPRVPVTLSPSTDYVLDPVQGEITFVVAPAQDIFVRVHGDSYGIFSDAELSTFVNNAVLLHLDNRIETRRYRDGRGFIKYDRTPMLLASLPEQEELLVAMLATIEALWALSTDAATDIDVQTAEGTSIPRSQRYRQVTAQIDLLTEKYKEVSLLMGVGLYAPEVLDLRRVSRSTNRLVPIFQEREYDENGPPIRKNLRVNTRESDEDGPASPFYAGGWGF